MEKKNIIIRLERQEEQRQVEKIVRKASGTCTARAAWSLMCCTS